MVSTDPGLGAGVPSGDFRVGGVISVGLGLFRDHLIHFMAIGVLLFIPVLAIALVSGDAGFFAVPSETEETPSAAASIGGVLYMFLWFIMSAAVTVSVVDALRDFTPSMGRSLSAGLARFLPLLGVSLVMILAIVAIFAVGGAAIAGLAAVTGAVGGPIALVLGIVLFVLFIYIYLRWALIVPVVVNERAGIIGTLKRSAELSRGHRWKLLGVLALLFLLSMIVSLVIPFGLVAIAELAGLASDALLNVVTVVNFIVQVIVALLFAVIICVAYYELRRVKEGVGVAEIAQVFD